MTEEENKDWRTGAASCRDRVRNLADRLETEGISPGPSTDKETAYLRAAIVELRRGEELCERALSLGYRHLVGEASSCMKVAADLLRTLASEIEKRAEQS